MSLEAFRHLSPVVSLYEPPSSAPAPSHGDPTTILLLSWADALPRHVAKYSAQYTTLYPGARIIMIPSTLPDLMFRSRATQRRRVAPAVAALLADDASNGSLLVHLFSNGGAKTLNTVAHAYRDATGATLPVAATVLDSCPGRMSFQASMSVMTVGVPKNPLIRLPVLGLISIFLGLLRLWKLAGRPNVIDRVRTDLLDKSLHLTEAPRCFIYSEGDRLVSWRDVEAHALEAEAVGWKVERIKMQGEHVGHMRHDKLGYWDGVAKFWANASSK
ncbi:MAG: hypothetical protein M1832_000737 [Thelocarpon impressellum]|nr:MAG: hypothetical protein M1832_000737 [Thelocarpon impressellum]